jgi:hypothetical protein
VPKSSKQSSSTSSHIEQYGWSCVGVQGDENNACFAYTIGLTLDGLPELLIFGLPHDRAWPVLKLLRERLLTGLRIQRGDKIDGVLGAGYSLHVLGRLKKSAYSEIVGTAANFFEHHNFDVYIIVWPTADGTLLPADVTNNLQREAYAVVDRRRR